MTVCGGLGVSCGIGSGRVNLNDLSRSSVNIQGPSAFYLHPATIPGGMHELAFPLALSDEFGFDLFQWFRELRLQKIMAHSTYGFLFSPAIELLSAMVPKVDHTLHGASHDALGCPLKPICILL